MPEPDLPQPVAMLTNLYEHDQSLATFILLFWVRGEIGKPLDE